MATPQEYIAQRAPDYVGDSRIEPLITFASDETGTSYGNNRNYAIALLVLHWMTLDDRDTNNQGIGGTIKREKEGRLEREYLLDFAFTSKYPDLSQTRWGLELIRIRKASIVGPMTRASSLT